MNQADLNRLLSDVAIRKYYQETYGVLLKQFEEKDEKMKQEFKVGDFVKLPHWDDYFKVTLVTEKEIEVVEEGKCYTTYSLNIGFIKKEEPVMSAVKNKIDPSKKYRKVNSHEPVRIICTDRKVDGGSLSCVGLWLTNPHIEAMLYFNHEGVDQFGNKTIEEIPKTNWSKVQVDTLIWVGNIPRHFAGYDGEWVYYFEGGTTSQTASEMKAYRVQTDALWCSLEKPND